MALRITAFRCGVRISSPQLHFYEELKEGFYEEE